MTFVNVSTLLQALGLGALAAAVPLVIHLLSKRRFRTVEWAAMRFLQEAERESRRRLQLEQLLLLLVRMLIAALVAWIVLRPVLQGGGISRLLEAQVHHVVVLDDSRSMGATTAGTTLLQLASEGLDELGARLAQDSPGDTLTLLRTSRPRLPDQLELAPTFRPSDGRAHLAAALRAAVREVRSRGATTSSILLCTDCCLQDLQEAGGQAPAELMAAAREASEVAELTVWDLADGCGRENVAVEELAISDGSVVAGAPVSLLVTVRNHGRRAAGEPRLTIRAGGTTRTLPPLEAIPAGQARTVEVPVAFREPGSTVVEVSLPPDHLPADDRAFLALEVLESLRVLIVDGEPGAGASGESWYLVHALAPAGPVRSGLSPEVATLERLQGLDLSPFAAVILANPYRLEAAQVESLERQVRQGTGLLIFPGDQTDADLFRRDLYREGKGLAPGTLGPRRGDPSMGRFATFAPPTGTHPVTSLFAGEGNPFLAPAKLYHWYELEPAADATVLLRTRGGLGQPLEGAGAPVLLEGRLGRGRVLLFGLPADDEWSGWVAEPSYLVTMQEALRYVAQGTAISRNVPLGARVIRPLDPTRFEVEAELRAPARPGELASSRSTTLQATSLEEFPLALDLGELQRAGVHELLLQGRDGSTVLEHHVALPPPEESNLLHADEPTLRQLLDGVPLRRVTSVEDLLSGGDEGPRRPELSRHLVLAVLLLLLVESFLAWRFGHHAGGAP